MGRWWRYKWITFHPSLTLLNVFCRFDLFCYPICISFIHRFKVMIKAEHAGDTCSAFSDVVNFVVGRTQDFAGSAVVVDVPGVRVNHSEHS